MIFIYIMIGEMKHEAYLPGSLTERINLLLKIKNQDTSPWLYEWMTDSRLDGRQPKAESATS